MAKETTFADYFRPDSFQTIGPFFFGPTVIATDLLKKVHKDFFGRHLLLIRYIKYTDSTHIQVEIA